MAKASADGYTLLAHSSTFFTAPLISTNAGYDPVRDFTPITLTCKAPMVLVTGAGQALKNLDDLVQQFLTVFQAKLLDVLDGKSEEVPIFLLDATDQTDTSLVHLNIFPDSVIGDTVGANTGSLGFYAAYGIMGALIERNRTGQGRRIETSMIESTIAFAPDAFINYKRYGIDVGPLTRVSASQSYAWRCQDGKLLAIHMSSQPKFWEGLLTAIERPELNTHPDFNTRELRIANYTKLRAELAKTFAARPRAEWTQRLEAQDVLERMGKADLRRRDFNTANGEPERHKTIKFDTFDYGILKKRIMEDTDENHPFWTMGHPIVFPNILKTTGFQYRVPVDDENTYHWWLFPYKLPEGIDMPLPQDKIPYYDVPMPSVLPNGRPTWDLLDNNGGQDIMMWITQGGIAGRIACRAHGSEQRQRHGGLAGARSRRAQNEAARVHNAVP